MIGELPDDFDQPARPAPERELATLPGGGGGLDALEMRLMAGLGISTWDTRYQGDSVYGNPWSGWSGFGGMGRAPPALIMSTAALRCRVVILDNLAKARPIIRDKDTQKEYTGEFAQALEKPMGK